jgi:hypothetical protein
MRARFLQVRWQEEDLSKSLNFFSVSSDGRVTLWTMSKSELQFQVGDSVVWILVL